MGPISWTALQDGGWEHLHGAGKVSSSGRLVSEIEALPPAFAKFITHIVSAMAAALLPAESRDDDTANWCDGTRMK